MKLSEILAKPIKLIGGGILNLKGFSKQVVDKEFNNVYTDLNELSNNLFNCDYIGFADTIIQNSGNIEIVDADDINVDDICTTSYESETPSETTYTKLFLIQIVSKEYMEGYQDYFIEFNILKELGTVKNCVVLE